MGSRNCEKIVCICTVLVVFLVFCFFVFFIGLSLEDIMPRVCLDVDVFTLKCSINLV